MTTRYDFLQADKAVKFLSRLKLTGDFHGQPFKVMPWQEQIIREVYGTLNERGIRQYRYVYVETAKKNAKSQLLSGIGIKHLYDKSEPHGQIVLCAGDKNQARKDIYEPLVEMIEQEPELERRVRITDSMKEIENRETGTRLQVISSESYTKHGWNISCCIFDELHVQPNRSLYDVMLKGAGLARRQPIWWFVTTAGDDPDRTSIAWEVHEKAVSIIKARKKGDQQKDIPTWYPVIYAYDGDDIWNERNWKKANPSLGTTIRIEDMRDLAQEAKLHPADERLFRWLNLNQWITTKLSSWLPLDLWDGARGNWKRTDMLGEDCYLGGDFSTTTDLSSVCLIFPPQKTHEDWRWSWETWIPEEALVERVRQDHVPYDTWARDAWITPTAGNAIDYTTIENTILDIRKQFNVLELGSDPAFATMLLQRLMAAGLECADIQQSYNVLTDPMNIVETLLRERKATHDGNPLVRWAFGNTSIHKNGNAQIKYVKEHRGHSIVRSKRIDPIAALVCGMARAKLYNTEASVYEGRGLITI
jgi:phage terminase large subunit-like protein